MEYARKMILVPEDRITKHVPSDEQLTDLDKEMMKILGSRLEEDAKIKLYTQILQKRINFNVLNPPALLDVERNEPEKKKNMEPTVLPEKTESPVKKESNIEEMILHTVPKKSGPAARGILKVLKKNAEVISWTPQGEVVIKNKVLPRSNIVDLIDTLVRSRKNRVTAVGLPQFKAVLEELNVPKTFIKNKYLYQSGKGVPVKKNLKKKNVSWLSL